MANRRWNWQSPDWPHFTYDTGNLGDLERQFIHQTGYLTGSIKHLPDEDQAIFTVELMSDEAYKTSEIEGQYLDRDSLQSSIRKNLGLASPNIRATPAEAGMAEMMVDLFENYSNDLSDQQLFNWQAMICSGRRDLDAIGGYRSHDDPMQIISNRLDLAQPRVHFEAPASSVLGMEMTRFLTWYKESASYQSDALLPLARAGIAHFYFLCIHPFEDGNGRIARAISEKALSQGVGRAALITLSKTIEANKNDYYAALEAHNFTLKLDDWLLYFGRTVLEAQAESLIKVEFLIEKTRFYDRFALQMNKRQAKVVQRLFEAGPEGFEGGLRAKNYQTIAKTPSATATRDLTDLVRKGILHRSGERKGTRYWLEMRT